MLLINLLNELILIISTQDTEKIEVEVEQKCNNVYHHHITNGGCKDTLL